MNKRVANELRPLAGWPLAGLGSQKTLEEQGEQGTPPSVVVDLLEALRADP